MLLNSAGEEKSEGEGHLALLKCTGNNVYEFSDFLPIVALVESINNYHHWSNGWHGQMNRFNDQLLKLAFMWSMEDVVVPL
jgi:hypothetical protein